MKIKQGYVLRSIAGENVVIPVGNAFADNRVMLTLNDTAALMWKKLADGAEIEDVVAAICQEYDVTPENAAADVRDFCSALTERNMLGE